MGLDVYAGFIKPQPERDDNVVDINDNIGEMNSILLA